MNSTPKFTDKKKLHISMILNAITIIGFLITVGTFIYSSGKKEARIEQLEKNVISLQIQNSQIIQQLNSTNNETSKVNAKLTLLLDYFHIAN